jgi:hypothetical protein
MSGKRFLIVYLENYQLMSDNKMSAFENHEYLQSILFLIFNLIYDLKFEIRGRLSTRTLLNNPFGLLFTN